MCWYGKKKKENWQTLFLQLCLECVKSDPGKSSRIPHDRRSGYGVLFRDANNVVMG